MNLYNEGDKMSRTRSDEAYNKKRLAISQTALQILLEEGAQKLSVNYLLRKMNMAKGVFFHYFKSKEELFNHVVHCAYSPILETMQSILQEKELSALEKLVRLYQSVGYMKADYGKGLDDLLKIMYREDNKLFLTALMKQAFEVSLPIFEEIILEGVATEDFYVDSHHAVAYHILTITMALNQEIGVYLLSDHKEANRKELMDKIMLSEKIIGFILNCNVSGKLYQEATLKRLSIL